MNEINIHHNLYFKPCPFCGDERIYTRITESTHFEAYCRGCFARSPERVTQKDVEREWNTRTNENI